MASRNVAMPWKPGQYEQIFGGGQAADTAAKTTVNNTFSKMKRGTTRSVHRMMNSVNNTMTMRTGKLGVKFIGKPLMNKAIRAKKLIGKAGVPAKATYRGINAMRRALPGPVKKLGIVGGFVAAGAAMMGVGMMRGAYNAANDIMAERYLADQRMSRNILMNTRVGYSHSQAQTNRYGQLNGLAQALNAGRHGRY